MHLFKCVCVCVCVCTVWTRCFTKCQLQYYNNYEIFDPTCSVYVRGVCSYDIYSTVCSLQVVIQPSSRRAYTMWEYKKAGAVISDDLSEADAIVGVCVCVFDFIQAWYYSALKSN